MKMEYERQTDNDRRGSKAGDHGHDRRGRRGKDRTGWSLKDQAGTVGDR